MNKREQMAAELAKEFPKLAINETGTFQGCEVRRVSPKMYRFNPPGRDSRLRMSKADIVNWFNTAPIELRGTLTKPTGEQVPATAEVSLTGGMIGRTVIVETKAKKPNPFIAARAQFRTVGECIDALEEAFDQKAGIHGAYILEIAAARAHQNRGRRLDEAQQIFDRTLPKS